MKKKLFGKFACAVLLGVMSLTSCVETDMYDEFFDEDLSSENLISRRKFKGDGSDWNGTIEEAWDLINSSSVIGSGECVAYAVSIVKPQSLPFVRTGLMPELSQFSGGGEEWVRDYVRAVKGDGIKLYTNMDEAHVVCYALNAYIPHDKRKDLNDYVTSTGGGEYKIKQNAKVLVVLNYGWGHWGVLTGLNKSFGIITEIKYKDCSGEHTESVSNLHHFWTNY